MNLSLALSTILAFGLACQADAAIRLKALDQSKSTLKLAAMAEKENDLFLVEWNKTITEAEKANLQEVGFHIIQYIPDNAFLVKGDENAFVNAHQLSFVNNIFQYTSNLKVEPEVGGTSMLSQFGNNLIDVTVTILGSLDESLRMQFYDVRQTGNLLVGKIEYSQISKLAQNPRVLWIERFLPFSDMELRADLLGEKEGSVGTFASTTGYESGTKILNVDAAYKAGLTGKGQLIAYSDTGLDSGNLATLIPDFQGQVKSAFAMGLGGSSWGDPASHGTHVAGSMAGNGKSSNGAIRGGSYEAQLVVEGLWSDIMNNIMIPGVEKLFDKANQEGARIHSNSWGAPNSNGRYDSFAIQVDTWLFNHQDFLAVFAAGNDGADKNRDGVVDEGSVSSPGSAKNVLTVGASKNFILEGGIQKKLSETRIADNWPTEPLASSKLSEDPRGMAAFSSRGPTADGRIKPEVVAPGTNIVSARSHHPKAKAEESWGIYDDNYLWMGGTSMATPVTSGAVGLVRQYLMQKTGGNVSAALIKAVMTNTATDLFPGQFGQRAAGQEEPTTRPNNHEGFGLINLDAIVNDASLRLVDEKVGLSTGHAWATGFVVNNAGKSLRVTMAYIDAPGAASASKALVNDLDLTVQDPKGNLFYPNHLSGKDSVNNIEHVEISNPIAGEYKVLVKGANVPQGLNGSQPFAVVLAN